MARRCFAGTRNGKLTLVSPPSQVCDALGRGATIITANKRAARLLGRLFAEAQRARGLRSWKAPAIYDWAGWTEGLYRQLEAASELPLLLHPFQEQLLWRRVQRDEGALVVSPRRLAELAASGYGLLGAYDAHASRRAPWAGAHEDAERFLAWASAFDRLCRELHVLPRAALNAELQARSAELSPLGELLLVGFDRLLPAERNLLQALERQGAAVAHAELDAPAAQQELRWAANEREEVESCAFWVRARLADDPGQRIGILVPELRGVRAALDRAFRRVLLPEAAGEPAGGALPYEFSLGVPLGSVPMIAAALLALRWLAGPLAAGEITSLLTGGFLAASPAESLALAEADRKLRERGLLAAELSLAGLLRHAERSPDFLPATALERLRAAEAWSRRDTGRRSYGEWAEAAERELAGLGWPGFGELSSVAFQARERWNALMGEVARLSFAGDTLPWGTFVRELAGFARDTLFAAESQNAPVQIMGIAEASGQNFDTVWFLGAAEDRWPAAGRMHPLLAAAVQRDAGMPHAEPALDQELGRSQLRRILASAPVVVCSYPREREGVEARLSPLLRHMAPEPAPAAVPGVPVPACELLRVGEPALVRPWPLQRVAGGSEVLKRQAACGFQSFAAKRLHADRLPDESWGLDARERAILLHRALERLWCATPVEPGSDRLHTHADLGRAIEGGRLAAMVEAAVAHSFRARLREAAGDPWRRSYLELEQQRLCTRLLPWLAIEKERAPFRVYALERRLDEAEVGELRLNLRADRIDEVEGGRLVIDYKTSDNVNVALWQGERPDEPQLPIYALFGGIEAAAGVAFAQIRAGKTKLHALAEDPPTQLWGAAPGKGKRDGQLLSDTVRDGWDHALRALAGQFARGEAPVNPKYGEKTCCLCGLQGLCRVREQVASRREEPSHV